MSDTQVQTENKVETTESKLVAIRKAMNLAFKERSDVVDGMLVALLAKEMMFLLGPPGTAKSAVCEAVCRAIGGNYYSWLISKVTTPEELFGPISVSGLKENRFERVTTNKLPEANVAFLDEIFKGSSAILNTLLPIINERKFFNGQGATKIPLQVLFGASNELPTSDELTALYDRFALRYEVRPLAQEDSLKDLLMNGLNVNIPSITLEDLENEQRAAAAVKLDEGAVNLILEIRKAINNLGLYVSDRKWMQAVRIVKAFAYLNGHTSVQNEDLEILANVLWSDPKNKREVRRIVASIANPVGEQIQKILDAVQDMSAAIKTDKISPSDAAHKIKTAARQLDKMKKDNPTNQALAEAAAKVKKIQLEMIQEHLGLTD